MAYAVSAPAAFTIQVTVPSIGSYYLEKGATGYGTKDLANAAKCAINPKTELVCDGVTVGTAYLNDMVPLTKNFGQNITTGFSVDDKDGIHWKNEGFRLQKVIVEKQGGEAKWALYPKNNGKYQLYAQLGKWVGGGGFTAN